MPLLKKEFYLREDVVLISKELLGKFLYTNTDGKLTGGMIVETEAYHAPEDKASHAFENKRTPRTENFYHQGGISYVYLCYGIHHLFNVVTNKKDRPHAILIRAIEPTEGIDTMLKRRGKTKLTPELTAGPGSLTMALGINSKHNGISLFGDTIWLEDKGISVKKNQIIASPRVGVDYAEEWAIKPWRFRIKNNPWTSKAK
jgi:DNA-3-methyladenine glycosylase